MGVILLALVAIVTDYSLVLMLRSAHISGSFSYQSLMKSAFGRYGFVVLSLLQFIYPFMGEYLNIKISNIFKFLSLKSSLKYLVFQNIYNAF